MDNGTALGLGLFVFLLIAVFTIAVFVFWVWAAIDAIKRPDQQWQAAGQNKIVWIALLVGSWFVGLPFIAALIYALWPRPALKRAETGVVSGGQPGYGPY